MRYLLLTVFALLCWMYQPYVLGMGVRPSSAATTTVRSVVPTTVIVTTTTIGTQRTVRIAWQQVAFAYDHIYTVHFQEMRDLTKCHYSSRVVADIVADGQKELLINNWCARFGKLKMGIKVRAYRKADHALSEWSYEISYQGACP